MSRRLTAVDVYDLACDEGGLFEIEDCVGDVADLADSAERAGHAFVRGGTCDGVWTMPGATLPAAPRATSSAITTWLSSAWCT